MTPVLGRLVKGIFDGVVCAFQSHTDTTTTRELANRLSRNVSAPVAEIEQLLLNDDKAVVGSLPRLLHIRGDGVIWSPADDCCVAGELVVEGASAAGWSIRAESRKWIRVHSPTLAVYGSAAAIYCQSVSQGGLTGARSDRQLPRVGGGAASHYVGRLGNSAGQAAAATKIN